MTYTHYNMTRAARGQSPAGGSTAPVTVETLETWMDKDEEFTQYLQDNGYDTDPLDFTERLDLFAEFRSDKDGGHLTFEPSNQFRL